MGTVLVELTGDEAKLMRSLDNVIKKQLEYERKLHDTGVVGDAAGVSLQGALARVQADADKTLNGLLRELKQVGPEGSSAAEALRTHLQEAGKAGHRSMDEVLGQIKAIDPAAAAAAESVRSELAEAAQYSEREFTGVLDELRKMGPQGRQAAAELRQHLVEAGKISEKSMQGVVDKLDQLDPESAAAARAIVANMEDAGNKGESAFTKFGKNAVGQIASVVTAYVGVQEAIQLVNGFLEEQQDLLRASKDTQIELAKAQQESAKNLAGLSVVERDELLRQAVPDIAAATGFSDMAEITQALGNVAATGESNSATIKDAVMQAARIERLKPEQLDSTAAAASAVQRRVGLSDIREALALVQTTGFSAKVTDPQKLVDSLPKALGSLVSTVPTQDPEEAVRQAGALFAQITQGGNDDKGASSATFSIDFGTRLQKFFTEMSDEQVKARSKNELIDRKIEKGKDTELDRLNRERNLEYLKATEGLKDPATLFGRLEVLQGNEALKRQFVGEGFGEKQFQTALTSLLEPTSDLSGALKQSFGLIQANTQFFEREAAAQLNLTPQLSLAAFDTAIKGSLAAQEVKDTEGASLAVIRQAAADVFKTTRPGGFEGVVDYAIDFSARGGLSGSTAAEEGLALTESLLNRAGMLRSDGIQAGDEDKLARIDTALQEVYRFLERQGKLGALDPEGVARAQGRAAFQQAQSQAMGAGPQFTENFARMADLLEQIAASTGATASAAAAPAPQPSMTPQLSNVTP